MSGDQNTSNHYLNDASIYMKKDERIQGTKKFLIYVYIFRLNVELFKFAFKVEASNYHSKETIPFRLLWRCFDSKTTPRSTHRKNDLLKTILWIVKMNNTLKREAKKEKTKRTHTQRSTLNTRHSVVSGIK